MFLVALRHNIKESPAMYLFRVAHKYDMGNALRHCFLNKDFVAFTARKVLVKWVMWDYEWRRWCISDLRHTSIENDIKMNVWWTFCKYNPECTAKVSSVIAITENTTQTDRCKYIMTHYIWYVNFAKLVSKNLLSMYYFSAQEWTQCVFMPGDMQKP